MVAPDDVCGDAVLVEPPEPLDELELRPNVSVRTVVGVAGDEQEVDLLSYAEVYYIPPGAVCRVGQSGGAFLIHPRQVHDPASEVEVSGMYKAKDVRGVPGRGRHRGLFTRYLL